MEMKNNSFVQCERQVPSLAQERLTRWEGQDPDGRPRAVLAKREGPWIRNMDEALRKLARLEDEEETEARNDRQGR